MIEINLREFYPECYRSDYFVEVPDEVAELLILLRRHEQSQRRRIYKHKAHYSLDIYENVERESMLKAHLLRKYLNSLRNRNSFMMP